MKGFAALVLVLSISACQHLPIGESAQAVSLWREAHLNLAQGEFAAAEEVFSRLAEAHPDTREGREAVFYLGAMRLDPRNAAWDPQPAAERLRRYAAMDTLRGGVARGPEARILLGLADQLNLPPAERVEGLAPETRVVQQRVVVPAQQSRELETEVARLRRQVTERDERIRQQAAEIERMRRALAPRN
jgi:TolA-binding protein